MNNPKSEIRNPKWPLNVGLALGGLLVVLAVFEVGLRAVCPQIFPRPKIWRHHAYLGWEHVPGARATWKGRDFKVPVEINSKGLRDRDYGYRKPEGVFRILAFGDSYVEGWGTRLDDVVTEVLERRLNGRDDGVPYEVINCGVAGYGTDQELLLFQREGIRYDPDLVLLFFYVNDVWNNHSNRGIGSERGYKPYFEVQRNGMLALRGVPVPKTSHWEDRRPRGLRGLLWSRSHLYAFVMDRIAGGTLSEQSRRYYAGLYAPVRPLAAQRAWRMTDELLRAFARTCEKAETKLLVVFVPARLQIHLEDWERRRKELRLEGEFDLTLPNRTVAQICERTRAQFFDLMPEFRRRAAEGTALFHPHDTHWNEEGHHLTAELLYDVLIAKKMIPL